MNVFLHPESRFSQKFHRKRLDKPDYIGYNSIKLNRIEQDYESEVPIMNIYDFTVKDAKGNDVSLNDYRGKVLLIVNTATGCGFTPQYDGLQDLYEAYQAQGFEILDFPCNQFGEQAPGTEEEIVSFCKGRFGITFKQFAKIDVNGENALPLYKLLKAAIPEETVEGLKAKMAMKAISAISKTCKEPGDIKWNFTKFLVDREGKVVGRFSPTDEPKVLEDKIKELL